MACTAPFAFDHCVNTSSSASVLDTSSLDDEFVTGGSVDLRGGSQAFLSDDASVVTASADVQRNEG